MPQADISFSNKQSTGQQELAGAPGVAVNVVVDQTGAIRRRPGLEAAPGFTSGAVDAAGLCGLYCTVNGALYAVGNTPPFRQIYRVTAAATALATPLTSDASIAGFLRPTFAETQLLLVVAAGDRMQKIILSNDTSSRLGGDPPYASHVVANSSRLLANIASVASNNTFDKSVVRYSDIANSNASYAGMEIWTEGLNTAGHYSAEADPDAVLGIYENTNEVFNFGNSSLQVFDPDPTAVYAPAVTRELGCSAPYSVVKENQQFFWLDDLRRFVMSDARSEEVISGPIQKTLDEIGTVSDCYGYRVVTGPIDALVWTFPTDGRTFAFQKGGGWAEWLGWSGGNWAPFPVTCQQISPTTHDNLVGDSSGRVGRLSLNATTDYGTPINARVETGYLARGTDERKWCKVVRVALRRGQTTGSSAPVAYISYRDQPGPYGAPIEVSLGNTGETEPVVELRSLGIYRRRQWRFEFSGTEALELVSVTEDYDVLST
jgi:hypothetical protein